MTEPTKGVAIFLPALYGGGAERTFLKLAGGIASRGYSVDLVLARKEGPLLSEVPNSVRVVDLHASRDLKSLPFLVRYLKRARPYAIISGLHTNIIAIWAKQIARVNTRVVVSERNNLSCFVTHYSSDLRMRIMPLLIRLFYPKADCVVAVSKGVAEDLIKVAQIPLDRVRVIYNPVVTPELKMNVQNPIQHSWLAPGHPPVILGMGRLTAQKDFQTLIKAFAQVYQSCRAKLMILGEGEDRTELELLIRHLGLETEVCLPGYIINPYPYMLHATVFVLSSRWEGLPGVLIEALYCGVPIIATDCPSGPREILANGKYGKLVSAGNVDAMAMAIQAALNGNISSPPLESWQPYELDFVVDQYIDMLINII
jgi:glycosyltransferase involved in cell wall biosynthesis